MNRIDSDLIRRRVNRFNWKYIGIDSGNFAIRGSWPQEFPTEPHSSSFTHTLTFSCTHSLGMLGETFLTITPDSTRAKRERFLNYNNI